MKNYIIALFALGTLVFGIMNWINSDKNQGLKEDNNNLTDSNRYLVKEQQTLLVENHNLKTALQKTDTTSKVIKGETIYIYNDVKPDSIDNTKTLIDSLRNDDLALQWEIKYSGVIHSFKPTWKLDVKTITVQNIVKEPYPVEVKVEVPINTRKLYLGGMVGGNPQQFNIYLGAVYTNKKRLAITFNMSPIDKSFLGGIYYKLKF